jgi:hypothetical protein
MAKLIKLRTAKCFMIIKNSKGFFKLFKTQVLIKNLMAKAPLINWTIQ